MTEPETPTDHVTTELAFDVAIGRVVRAAATLESLLATIHIQLLRSPVAHVVSDGMPADSLLHNIKRLTDASREHGPHFEGAPTISDGLYAAIGRLIANTRPLMTDRHSVVHGSWGLTPDDMTVRMTQLRRRSGPVEITWTLDRLRELRNALVMLHQDAFAIVWEVQEGTPLPKQFATLFSGDATEAR